MKFLSVLICVHLWLPLSAQVRMTVEPSVIRITGPDWTLQYGTRRTWFRSTPQFLSGEGDRAWFSHGPRLRLIETRQGRVLGRWLFPGEISGLKPQDGGHIQVEVEERNYGPRETVERHTFLFDPQNPAAPYWPTPPLFWGSPSACEPQFFVARSTASNDCPRTLSLQPLDRIDQALPALEDMVRRDPFTPWFALTLGEALRMKGDPRAGEWLNRAANAAAGNPDFLDLLAMAEVLERLGEDRAAGAAFDAGFQDFLARGHHPRLFLSEYARRTLFASNWIKLAAAGVTRSHLERVYRLAPATESAAESWEAQARIAKRGGNSDEATLWRTRAFEARSTTLYVREPASSQRVDWPLRVALGAALGALLLLLSCSGRYFRRRAPGSEPGEFRFFLTEYWTWPERAAFLFLALTAWLAVGVAGGYFRGVLRLEQMPYSARFGSFAGPSTAVYFENELPASLEQQMLVNLARRTGPVPDDAVPTPEKMERALGLRVSTTRAILWAVGGPITAGSFLKSGTRYMFQPLQVVQATVILTCLLLPLAVFILLVPRQEAFAWSRQGKVWDVLVPVSAWGWLGGFVLLAFGIFLVQDAMVYARGAPCFVASTCTPAPRLGLDEAAPISSNRPGALWLYGAPLAIWAVNLIIVFWRSSANLRLTAGAALRP